MAKKNFRMNPPTAAIAVRQLSRETGASRIVIRQIKDLKELGFRVIVLCEKGNTRLITSVGAKRIRLIRWPTKGKIRRFWFNWQVKKWEKRNKPNILISHGDAETKDILYMHNCIHLTHERVYNNTGKSFSEVAPLHDYILEKKSFKHIVANSTLMANDISKRYEIEPGRIEIHYPRFDKNKFNMKRARMNRKKTRDAFGVKGSQIIIGLITSGDFTVRNVSFFIDIAFSLETSRPGFYKFIVIGKDDPTEYKEKCSNLGISENFIWRSTVSNIEDIYGAVDLIVLPAHIETFCCVALEAMGCGTPVMLSPWIGACEIIENKIPDLIIDDHNLSSWHERIIKISNPESLMRLGKDVEFFSSPYSEEYGKNHFKELISRNFMGKEK